MKGSNLWEKQNVIINGERIVKVARVAQQVPPLLLKPTLREPSSPLTPQFAPPVQLAKLVAELIQDGVPIHGAVCISEYLHWAKDLCDLSDSFVSSKMVGVGIKFRVDGKNTAIVKEIVQGGPAEDTDILVGGVLKHPSSVSSARPCFFLVLVSAYWCREASECDWSGLYRRAVRNRRQERLWNRLPGPIPRGVGNCAVHGALACAQRSGTPTGHGGHPAWATRN